jgi:hypothetical protein
MYHGLDNDVERNKAGSAEHPGKIVRAPPCGGPPVLTRALTLFYRFPQWVDGKRDVVLDNVARKCCRTGCRGLRAR